MAAQNTSQGSGALASVTGFFKDLVNQATPAVQSYFDYRTAREGAPSTMPVAGYAGGNTGVVPPGATAAPAASVPLTSQPWFPWAVGAVVLLTGGLILFAFSGRSGK